MSRSSNRNDDAPQGVPGTKRTSPLPNINCLLISPFKTFNFGCREIRWKQNIFTKDGPLIRTRKRCWKRKSLETLWERDCFVREARDDAIRAVSEFVLHRKSKLHYYNSSRKSVMAVPLANQSLPMDCFIVVDWLSLALMLFLEKNRSQCVYATIWQVISISPEVQKTASVSCHLQIFDSGFATGQKIAPIRIIFASTEQSMNPSSLHPGGPLNCLLLCTVQWNFDWIGQKCNHRQR